MRVISFGDAERFVEDNLDAKLWLSKVGSPNTRIRYAKALMIYCEWMGLTPKALLELKHNQKNHDSEKKLDLFVLEMKAEGLSRWSLRNIVNAVKSFHRHNYEDLASRCGRVHVAAEKPRRTPTQDKLNEFIKQSNVRDVALITFLASVPVREGTLCGLTWGHVLPNIDQEFPHIQIIAKDLKGKGYEKYRDLEQHCFLTLQAKKKLLQYKTWREKREHLQMGLDDCLFASVYESGGKYKALKPINIRKIFERRSKATGIKFSPHDLRRYAQTQLEQSGMNPNWIRKILGHKVSGEEAPYSQPKICALRDAFQKAVPLLIIRQEPTAKPAEVKRLQTQIEGINQENIKLKQRLNSLTLGSDQVEELLRRIEKLEQKAKQNQ